jgi:hypothetical protein
MRTRHFVIVSALLLSFTGLPMVASAQQRQGGGGHPVFEACQPGIEVAASRNPE